MHIQHNNLIDQKFGKLTVIKKDSPNKDGKAVWLCKCECGTIKRFRLRSLLSGDTKSCLRGSCRPNFTDLTQKRFGKLVVLALSHKKGEATTAHWECKCDCGILVTVASGSLVSGGTKSCGCMKRDSQYETIKNDAYSNHRKGATARGIVTHLSKKEYIDIASMNCYYCGRIDIKKNRLTKVTINLNGIDRKNNESYYEIDNSIPCCKLCNMMKRKIPHDDFITIIRYIYGHTENINLDK